MSVRVRIDSSAECVFLFIIIVDFKFFPHVWLIW